MTLNNDTGIWRYRGVLTGMTLAFSLALTGCGGGGGGSSSSDDTTGDNTDGDDTTTYSGVVEAPSAQLAQLRTPGPLARLGEFLMPSTVAAVTGLEPVPNVDVELVRLNNDGTVAEVVATVSADGNGVFTLDSQLAPNAEHVFSVSASGGATMRVPMARTDVDINPATELVVRAMESAISDGASLDDWTPEELDSLVVQAVESDVDLSGCTSVDDCVTTAEQQAPTVQEDVQVLANNDGVTGPEGDFRFTALELSHTHPFWEVGHYYTEMSLGFSGGELSGSTTAAHDDWWRNDETGLEFDTSASESLSFSYSPGADGRLVFSDALLRGGYSADGQVAAMVIRHADVLDGGDTVEQIRGLAIGVKRAASTPSLSGDYNLLIFSEAMNAEAADSREGERDYETGVMSASASGGTLSLDPFTGSSSEITLPAADSGVTGSVFHESTSDPEDSLSYTVAADGGMSFAHLNGQVRADGGFFFAMGRDEQTAPPEGWLDIVLATRAGSSMGAADLNGEYNLYSLEGDLSENEDGLMTSVMQATFDGSGSLDLSGVEYESDVGFYDTSHDGVWTESFTDSGIPYTVSPTGEVTLGGGDAVGAVTPDGELLVLVFDGVEDDDGDGVDDGWWHGITIGFKEPGG